VLRPLYLPSLRAHAPPSDRELGRDGEAFRAQHRRQDPFGLAQHLACRPRRRRRRRLHRRQGPLVLRSSVFLFLLPPPYPFV
jgi:hypothetical protein